MSKSQETEPSPLALVAEELASQAGQISVLEATLLAILRSAGEHPALDELLHKELERAHAVLLGESANPEQEAMFEECRARVEGARRPPLDG